VGLVERAPIAAWIGRSARYSVRVHISGPVHVASLHIKTKREKKRKDSGLVLSLFIFIHLMMSSSFSAHDFDDDAHSVSSTHQSFIDLSPSHYHTHTHPSPRGRSGSAGSEDSMAPLHSQRSNIRINTSVVRICAENNFFQRLLIDPAFGSFPV